MRTRNTYSMVWYVVSVCVAVLIGFGLSACSPASAVVDVASSQSAQQEVSAAENDGEEIEIDEDQLVMKVSNASEFEVPLDEVTVTVYNSVVFSPTANDEAVENAIKRLKMMGIKHIVRKDTTSMDMNIVVHRSPEYAQVADLIAENLGFTGHKSLEIPNDGSGGWSYSTDIAVVISEN